MAYSSFYQCFKATCDGVGIPAPESVFGTLAAATGALAAIAKAIKDYGGPAGSVIGGGVTISELFGAGLLAGTAAADLASILGYIGAMTASFLVGFWAGAMIGCGLTRLLASNGTASTKKINQYFKDETGDFLPEETIAYMDVYPEMCGRRAESSFKSTLCYYGLNVGWSNSGNAVA